MAHNIFIISLLCIYNIFLIGTGYLAVRMLDVKLPQVAEYVGGFLIGVGVGIPLTYFFSSFYSDFTKEPMIWGVASVTIICLIFGIFRLKCKVKKLTVKKQDAAGNISDCIFLLFSFVFSMWLMGKTFRGGPDGQIFVGSNTIFDFGLLTGLIRSMSWGANIPLNSPFFSGMPFFYHFSFQFWAALWEYLGIPLVWAINIPSILSFTALLIVVYSIPQIIGNQGKLVAWIGVLLTITHSTLTFWFFILQKGISVHILQDLWYLPAYPFAGPFDGSTISIYMTLNNFVNQRHLAFSIAFGLFLFVLYWQASSFNRLTLKKVSFLGCCSGVLFLWNMPVCFLTACIIICAISFTKQWKNLVFFLACFFAVIILTCIQFIPVWGELSVIVGRMATGTFGSSASLGEPDWTPISYLWENMGILPLVVFVGYICIPKKAKLFYVPFILIWILECFVAGIGKRGFDQKFFSYIIIPINVVAAMGIGFFWKKGGVLRFISLLAFFVVTVSGIVDLMALKNEFAFPFISEQTRDVVSWIRRETPKNAVFVSYSDIIDPVVLAGRKNYFGFYGNIGWTDRIETVRRIYGGDTDTAIQKRISYILVPKKKEHDFPYTVDDVYFREHRMVVYEDEIFYILKIPNCEK